MPANPRIPEVDVAAYLPAQVNARYPAALLTTNNVVIGPLLAMRESVVRRPDFLVGVFSDGGAPPTVFFQHNGSNFDDVAGVPIAVGDEPNGLRVRRVTVHVRGDPIDTIPAAGVDAYTRALLTAEACCAALNGRAPTGYLGSDLLNAGPTLLTQDSKGRFLFTLATDLWVAT